MRRIFQTFVDRLTESSDACTLQQSMTEIVRALDLRCFAYLSLPRNSKQGPVLISTYPSSWTTHYLHHHYERFDPVIARALRKSQPFEWGLGIGPPARSEPERELFEEGARFGIRCGFTIPVHDSSGAIAAVTFAADERRPRFERSIKEHGDVLQLVAMYFHAHARRQIISRAVLTTREIECLEWAAQGKTAWETGRILGISRHTVAFHLDNAKAKLRVRSTIQAVAALTKSKLYK
jgi:LuxR family transcriptional activator of conjugal transfer of Ti plasmids